MNSTHFQWKNLRRLGSNLLLLNPTGLDKFNRMAPSICLVFFPAVWLVFCSERGPLRWAILWSLSDFLVRCVYIGNISKINWNMMVLLTSGTSYIFKLLSALNSECVHNRANLMWLINQELQLCSSRHLSYLLYRIVLFVFKCAFNLFYQDYSSFYMFNCFSCHSLIVNSFKCVCLHLLQASLSPFTRREAG